MRSNSIRSIRRAELSRAAFEAVTQFGLRGATLDKIGEIAGVSKGLVLHHFKDKSALLEAVFRQSNAQMGQSVVELYRYAETPYERLWAVVITCFHQSNFNQKVCQAWVSLISEVPQNQQCQRIQIACNRRIQSNLRHEIKQLLEQEEAEKAARQLSMLIEGIWVLGGLLPEPFESSSAISELEYAISKHLPFDEISARRHRQARKKIEKIADIALGSTARKGKLMQS